MSTDQNDTPELLTRRKLLSQFSTGMAGVALTKLLVQDQVLKANPRPENARQSGRHFPATARRVIHIYLGGGLSQVDTFDYKPALYKWHGNPMPSEGPLDTFSGNNIFDC